MLQAWVHGCQSRLPTTAATACANKIFQKSSLKLLMVNKIFRNKLEKIWRDQLNCDFLQLFFKKMYRYNHIWSNLSGLSQITTILFFFAKILAVDPTQPRGLVKKHLTSSETNKWAKQRFSQVW
jgi:hypothetical protein